MNKNLKKKRIIVGVAIFLAALMVLGTLAPILIMLA